MTQAVSQDHAVRVKHLAVGGSLIAHGTPISVIEITFTFQIDCNRRGAHY